MLSEAKQKMLMDGAFIPAIPLALDEKFSFDEQRQRALLRYYLAAGADGIAAAVHTTQFEIREHPETFERLLYIVIEEIEAFERQTGSAILRIAGISGQLEQAELEAEFIHRIGYDAGLLSVSAYPSDSDIQVLIDHYRSITEIIPVFGFYLQQAVGGRYLPYEFWKQVLQNERVIGVKAAPFDRYRTIDTARACAVTSTTRKTPAALYTGNDDSIVADLLTTYSFSVEGKKIHVPVRGGLLGHWSVWVKTAAAIFREVKQIRQTGMVPMDMLTRAAEITDANSAFFDAANNFAGCIAGIHEVLRRQGFFERINCYAENGILSPGQAEEIDRIYAMYPHLHDDEFVKKKLPEWFEA